MLPLLQWIIPLKKYSIQSIIKALPHEYHNHHEQKWTECFWFSVDIPRILFSGINIIKTSIVHVGELNPFKEDQWMSE